jgi:anti-sigma factor RsiW
MNKLYSAASGIYGLLLRYPAVSAALANIAVVMAATFGFHLTADQVVTTVSFTAALTGVLVHAGVIPMHKARKGEVPLEVKQAVIEKESE